ncbi:MAG: TauD/TfdA dioxygenase family protein [Pseudomonadales bacterium]
MPIKHANGNLHLTYLTATPLSGPLGAAITDINLAQCLTADTVAELRSAFNHYGLLWFPGQSLAPEQQADFAERFGELEDYPFITPLAEHSKVIPIIKEPDTRMNFGGGWHTDTSYLPKPPSITMLQAIEVPKHGGDTLFADMALAFESLSPGMRTLLDGLRGVYTADLVHGKSGMYSKQAGADHPMDYGDSDNVAPREVEHPIIRTHPETGRKSIYAGLAHCARIRGMTTEESKVLLEFINQFATRAEFVTRLQWQPDSLAMWDNRRLFHYALNDYPGQRRHMHRVTIQGDAPF